MASISWYKSQISTMESEIAKEEKLIERLREDKKQLDVALEMEYALQTNVGYAEHNFEQGDLKLSKSFKGVRANRHRNVNKKILEAYVALKDALLTIKDEAHGAKQEAINRINKAQQNIYEMNSRINYYERCIEDLEAEEDDDE